VLARVLWCCLATAGCSATVIPPAAPPRPTTVYLCDYGYHSDLLLPVGNGVYVEYLYGDWAWAAMNDTGAASAVRAGLFSTRSTLGRRCAYDPAPDAVPRPVTPALRQLPIVVDGELARRLVASLDARWRSHADTAVNNGAAGAFYLYVDDDQPYGMIHNCNRLTAEWLEQLGCRTSGVPLMSHFDVRQP
jgi:hypothetical protein